MWVTCCDGSVLLSAVLATGDVGSIAGGPHVYPDLCEVST